MANQSQTQRKEKTERQRMSYEFAKREMERVGWENPSEDMIWVYSYLGRDHFSGLMDRAAAAGDIELSYLERATERKLKGTVHQTQIYLNRRDVICNEILELILSEEKEGDEERAYLRMCNADNVEEITRDIQETHKTIDPVTYIGTLDREFRKVEGWDREFSAPKLTKDEWAQIRYGMEYEGEIVRNNVPKKD